MSISEFSGDKNPDEDEDEIQFNVVDKCEEKQGPYDKDDADYRGEGQGSHFLWKRRYFFFYGDVYMVCFAVEGWCSIVVLEVYRCLKSVIHKENKKGRDKDECEAYLYIIQGWLGQIN